MVRRRCFPDNVELIQRIDEVKKDWEHGKSKRHSLRVLYLMTNEKREWLDEFKKQMLLEGWERVVTSIDLVLNSQELAVGMAVDMEIGRKAEVFIGNGVRCYLFGFNADSNVAVSVVIYDQ